MKNTEIEWATHTFNPWVGCTKVSPGCKNCYAESYDRRVGGVPVAQRDPNRSGPELRWGVGARRTRTSISYWNQPKKWNADALKSGERPRVFCASLADVFDPEVPGAWRFDLWALIYATPALDWLLLTKRPENIPLFAPYDLLVRNVWLGTTVEDQRRAQERIPKLLAVPAAVHFLSCEPLLEHVRIDDLGGEGGAVIKPLAGLEWRPGALGLVPRSTPKIDWVICGGESGPGSRPMHIDWARSLRDQCAAAGVPFLHKQWGEFSPSGQRVGKKISGRLLDGVQHDGYPEVRT